MALNSELLVGSYNCDGFTSSSTYLHVDSYNCWGLPNLITNDDIDPDDNFYNDLILMLIVYTIRRKNLMTKLYQKCKLLQHFPLSTLMLEVCQQILVI